MPIIIITEPNCSPKKYRVELNELPLTIGKGADCDIVLEDQSTSTLHCKLKRVEGGILFEDNQSTNGSMFNGAMIKQKKITENTEITLSLETQMSVQYSPEEIKIIAKEQLQELAPEKASEPNLDAAANVQVSEEDIEKDKRTQDEKRLKPSLPVGDLILRVIAGTLILSLFFILGVAVKYYQNTGKVLFID